MRITIENSFHNKIIRMNILHGWAISPHQFKQSPCPGASCTCGGYFGAHAKIIAPDLARGMEWVPRKFMGDARGVITVALVQE